MGETRCYGLNGGCPRSPKYHIMLQHLDNRSFVEFTALHLCSQCAGKLLADFGLELQEGSEQSE